MKIICSGIFAGVREGLVNNNRFMAICHLRWNNTKHSFTCFYSIENKGALKSSLSQCNLLRIKHLSMSFINYEFSSHGRSGTTDHPPAPGHLGSGRRASLGHPQHGLKRRRGVNNMGRSLTIPFQLLEYQWQGEICQTNCQFNKLSTSTSNFSL